MDKAFNLTSTTNLSEMFKNKKSVSNKDNEASTNNANNKSGSTSKYDMDEIFKKCTNYKSRKSTSEKINDAFKKYSAFSKK